MQQREITPCPHCRNTGRLLVGYQANGQPRVYGRCDRCEGTGFLPTLNGGVLNWRTARGLMAKENAAPATESEQGRLL